MTGTVINVMGSWPLIFLSLPGEQIPCHACRRQGGLFPAPARTTVAHVRGGRRHVVAASTLACRLQRFPPPLSPFSPVGPFRLFRDDNPPPPPAVSRQAGAD